MELQSPRCERRQVDGLPAALDRQSQIFFASWPIANETVAKARQVFRIVIEIFVDGVIVARPLEIANLDNAVVRSESALIGRGILSDGADRDRPIGGDGKPGRRLIAMPYQIEARRGRKWKGNFRA